MPFVADMSATPAIRKESGADKLRLLYAGSPGRKDELEGVISAGARLSETADFELRIIGASRADLLSSGVRAEELDALEGRVYVEPRKSRAEVLEAYSRADFSILFRRSTERYAKAGFPTKFTESLSTGTPVLLNLSSDLNLYAHDQYNALIAQDHTASSVGAILEQAMSLSLDQKRKMSSNSRRSAEAQLDCYLYTDVLSGLLS